MIRPVCAVGRPSPRDPHGLSWAKRVEHWNSSFPKYPSIIHSHGWTYGVGNNILDSIRRSSQYFTGQAGAVDVSLLGWLVPVVALAALALAIVVVAGFAHKRYSQVARWQSSINSTITGAVSFGESVDIVDVPDYHHKNLTQINGVPFFYGNRIEFGPQIKMIVGCQEALRGFSNRGLTVRRLVWRRGSQSSNQSDVSDPCWCASRIRYFDFREWFHAVRAGRTIKREVKVVVRHADISAFDRMERIARNLYAVAGSVGSLLREHQPFPHKSGLNTDVRSLNFNRGESLRSYGGARICGVSVLQCCVSVLDSSIGGPSRFVQAVTHVSRLAQHRNPLKHRDEREHAGERKSPPILRRYTLLLVAAIAGYWLADWGLRQGGTHGRRRRLLAVGLGSGAFVCACLLWLLTGFRWSWGWWL